MLVHSFLPLELMAKIASAIALISLKRWASEALVLELTSDFLMSSAILMTSTNYSFSLSSANILD